MALETLGSMASDLERQEMRCEVAVREQRTIGPGGMELVRRTAACPLREGATPLSICEVCPRKQSLSIDSIGGHSTLVCLVPEEAPGGLRVSDLMSRRLICVRSDLTERAVLMVLVEHGISGAPVIDVGGRPVGVVSMADLLREQYDAIEDEEDELLPHWVRGAVDQHRVGGRGGRPPRTAEELMTPSMVSVREDASPEEAADLMARHRVHRLPVVASDGTLVGLVSALDLVRWMASLAISPPSRPER